ncbi:MAG: DUF192 domain-containing protein [Ignavibacteriales bacterium]|nr:DUF192 domain-containing protein [Ignavibacteriales bacterium]
MSKTKSKNKDSKSKSFQITIVIVLVAFVILALANLFTDNNPTTTTKNIVKKSVETFNFKKEGELTFQSKDGDFIDTINIEFADNVHERSQGLMYRSTMEENQGMLFIFPYEERQSFFMRNTIISLDMIFINSKLEIVTIHKNTEPYSEESKVSTAPAQYVLETIAGYTDKYNISVGDKVIFRKTN